MKGPSPISAVRVSAVWSLLATMACAPTGTPVERSEEPVPAKLLLTLSPAAETFEIGTRGLVSARVVDQAGAEMAWRVPRRIESSDTAVLSVDSIGAVLARSVGTSWLRVTWAGPMYVRDSVHVHVGTRGVGRMRDFSFLGCWVIETDPQTAYEPTNLPNAFKSDGLRVRFAARPSEYGSLCGVGRTVDLDSIRIEAP